MDTAAVTNRRESTQGASAPSTRTRFSPEYARQAATDDAVRQKERAEYNRAIQRRQSMAEINKDVMQDAYQKLYAQDRAREKENAQAGVDKMVRSVIRKASAETEKAEGADANYDNAGSDYMRDKVNTTYNNTSNYNDDSPREKALRPSPSERQQQRAIENYQQSTRNPVDQTLELVV